MPGLRVILGIIAGLMFSTVLASAQTVLPQNVVGWERERSSSGDLLFVCRAQSCGGTDAFVSIVRHREVLRGVTPELFMQQQRINSDNEMKTMKGSRSAVSLRSVSTVGAIEVFTAWQDVIKDDGKKLFLINALLPGPQASITVVTLALSREQVSANFDDFLPRLLDLVR